MKIAYFTEWSPYHPTGVLHKIMGQARTWKQLGHDVKIISLCPLEETSPEYGFSEIGVISGTLTKTCMLKYPRLRLGYFNKVLSVRQVLDELARFQPDAIYYRQNGPWYPGLSDILRTAPTFLEINTNEAQENKEWGRFFYHFDKHTKKRIYEATRGFVFVTNEISRQYSHLEGPSIVIPNGFWRDVRILTPTQNIHPNFVFVGSPMNVGKNWHGVDKLVTLAEQMPLSIFNIVGPTLADLNCATIPPNIIMHGEKSGAQLRKIFSESDIGIGTLALHRKGMDEACPLKVRDYLMNGLPTIIGYKETEDFLNTAEFILRIPNNESNIRDNIHEISEFSYYWKNKRVNEKLAFMQKNFGEKIRVDFINQNK